MASAADDASAGVLVTHAPYPEGESGIRMSLTEMAEKVRAGAPTAVMKSYAGNVLREAGFPRSVRGKAGTLLSHVRQKTGYAPDAPFTESIQAGAITLCVDGAPICIPIGDCDDLTVALATLLAAAGMQVRLTRQIFPPMNGVEPQQHVLCEVLTEDGEWFPLDPSHPTMPAGQKSLAAEETYCDPWSTSAGFNGQAQLVGIGALPVFMMTEDGWQRLPHETKLGQDRRQWLPVGGGVERAVHPALGAPQPREAPKRVVIDLRELDHGGLISDLMREGKARVHRRGFAGLIEPMPLTTAVAAGGAILLASGAIAAVIRRARSKR